MTRPWHFRFDDAVRNSRDLSTSERALLFVLRTHADGRTGEVQARFAPSLTVLGEETGMARRSVSRVIKEVVAKGWLEVRPPTTRNAITLNHTNAYTLLIPTAQASPTTTPRDTASLGVGTQTTDPSDTRSHCQTSQTTTHSASQRPPHSDGVSGQQQIIEAAVVRAGEEWDAAILADSLLARGKHPRMITNTIDAQTRRLAAEPGWWE